MKRTSVILTILSLITLTSCDPVHDIRLENKTNENIEVIYFPTLDQQELEGIQATEVTVDGRKMSLVTLEPTKAIRIGQVSARYTPKPSDIHFGLSRSSTKCRHFKTHWTRFNLLDTSKD